MTLKPYSAEVLVRLRFSVPAESPTDAEGRAYSLVERRSGVFTGEIVSVATCDATKDDADRSDSFRLWQEFQVASSYDAPGLLAQWSRGRADDESLAKHARDELFAPFAGFQHWSKLKASAIRHPRDRWGTWLCRRAWHERPMTWSTSPLRELTSSEHEIICRAQAAADISAAHPWLEHTPGSVILLPQVHRGHCGACNQAVSQHTFLVTIGWAGRSLSREYRLS